MSSNLQEKTGSTCERHSTAANEQPAALPRAQHTGIARGSEAAGHQAAATSITDGSGDTDNGVWQPDCSLAAGKVATSKAATTRIACLTFDNPYFLAPLAGITDAPFRRICRRYGAGLVYSEMISAKGLFYNDKVTEKLLAIYDDELPVAYQIFGSEPEVMAYAAEALSSRRNCLIDINMGCPVPKVTKNGDGSALLKDPKLISQVVEAVVKKAKKPVTAKIRIGWDEDSINAVEVAKRLEAAGAAAIAVHGRTKVQMYSGTADREVIRHVKESVSIPVIGNGDIFDVASAQSMFRQTGCDMVMVARGALGNPWIFRSLIEGRDYRPSAEEKVAVIKEHFRMLIEEKGEYAGVRSMRKHIGWYIKGMHGATSMRRSINELESAEEIYRALDDLLEKKEGV